MTDCSCSNKHDSSGFVSGLAVGLVFGAAGAHYLNTTKEGKELLDNLKDKASQAIDSVKDNPALSEKIEELQKTMDTARATINTGAQRVADATDKSHFTSPKHGEGGSKKNFFQKMGASLGK